MWRSGVLLSVLLGLAACDLLGGGPTIRLDDEREVSLPGGADLHEVTVSGAGSQDSIAPAAIEANAGDAIRFTVTDHRTHALAFVADSLSPAARRFLDATVQLRGPPLVNEGAAWVVLLQDAPAGRYPFLCRSHDAGGVITVTGDD